MPTDNGSNNSQNTLRITRRLVDIKRHTQGYVVDGQNMSVRQVTRLARQGRVSGVRVVGNHIQSVSGRRRLYDLPTQLVS